MVPLAIGGDEMMFCCKNPYCSQQTLFVTWLFKKSQTTTSNREANNIRSIVLFGTDIQTMCKARLELTQFCHATSGIFMHSDYLPTNESIGP